MKKLLFISIITAMTFSHINAQEIPPFKPFEEFKGDTLAYLEYTYDNREAYYMGQPFSEIMKDLYFTPTGFSMASDSRGVSAICIYVHNIIPGMQNELKDYYIEVVWETPIESTKQLTSVYTSKKWVPQHYEFFKDMVVKRVGINPYLKEDRKSGRWRPGGKY